MGSCFLLKTVKNLNSLYGWLIICHNLSNGKNKKSSNIVLVFPQCNTAIPANSSYSVDIELNASKEQNKFTDDATFNYYFENDENSRKKITFKISACIIKPYLTFDRKEIDFGFVNSKSGLMFKEYLRIENPTNNDIEITAKFTSGCKFKSFINSDFVIPANESRYLLICLDNDFKKDLKSESATLNISNKSNEIVYEIPIRANYENKILITSIYNEVIKMGDSKTIKYFNGYQKIAKINFQITNSKTNNPLAIEFSSKVYFTTKKSFILFPKEKVQVVIYWNVDGYGLKIEDYLSILVNNIEQYKIKINCIPEYEIEIMPVIFHVNANSLEEILFSNKQVSELIETKLNVHNKKNEKFFLNFPEINNKYLAVKDKIFAQRQTNFVQLRLLELSDLSKNNQDCIKAITDSNQILEIPYTIRFDKSHLKLSINNGALYLGLLVLESKDNSECSKSFSIQNTGNRLMNVKMKLNAEQLESNKKISFKIFSTKNNNTSELSKDAEFNIDSNGSHQEFLVKVSLNSIEAKPGYYFQRINLFSTDDVRLHPVGLPGRKYQRDLLFFWKVIKDKNSNKTFEIKPFDWHKTNQKGIHYKNIDQTELIELTYPSLQIAFMLEGNRELTYPKSIDEYAKLVSPNNNKLEDKIKSLEEKDDFKDIGLDFTKATNISISFSDYTKKTVNSENKYLYEAFLHLLNPSLIPKMKGKVKTDFIENSMQIILSTISETDISEAFFLFSEKFLSFFNIQDNELSSFSTVINGFSNSDHILKKYFEPIAKNFEKILQKHEDTDQIFNFFLTQLSKNKYIKQMYNIIINNNGNIKLLDLMIPEEQSLVKHILNQIKNDEDKTLINSLIALLTYLSLLKKSYPKLENEIDKIKLFFTTFKDDFNNFQQFNFDCLQMFFNKQEIDFFHNIFIGMSLLFTNTVSVTDTVRQFFFKFSLQIIKYASNELYADNLKCFEEFLKSSEVKSSSLQKEERKKAALKFFRIYNEKVDQMMQKVLTAKYVSDVLESYLEYIYLSNGKSIIEIYKIESIISQFLSIEPLIKMKRFYSIWPYLIYISHLKQDNNQLILEISATLKIFYNSPNFQNGLAFIKCLTVYLIDDQKKGNGMNELSFYAILIIFRQIR